MTAGTGVVHSEYNPSNTEEVNFLQLWFLPEKSGLMPSYEQKAYDQNSLKNHLLPVVSNRVQSENVSVYPSGFNTVFVRVSRREFTHL